MKVSSPPTSGTGLENIIAKSIRELNKYFAAKDDIDCVFKKKGFEDYFSQFKWFESELLQKNKILDIGCSYGRESFALMWFFGANQTIGIDAGLKKIQYVHHNPIRSLQTLTDFVPKFIDPSAGYGLSVQYIEEFRTWWESKVHHDLRNSVENNIIPEFIHKVISESGEFAQSDIGFDLIYCCNVLDELVNERKDWYSAIRNIAIMVKPETGRVVVVGATTREITEDKHSKHFMSLDDFKFHFQDVGLELIKEERAHLGYLDWPETNPVGHIYRKC